MLTYYDVGNGFLPISKSKDISFFNLFSTIREKNKGHRIIRCPLTWGEWLNLSDNTVDSLASFVPLGILEVMLLDCLNAVTGKFSDGQG